MAHPARTSRPDTHTESITLSSHITATDTEGHYTHTYGLCSPDCYTYTESNHTYTHSKGHHPDAYDKPSADGKRCPNKDTQSDAGGHTDPYTVAYCRNTGLRLP